MANEFIVEDAVREQLPIRIGLTGATNTGKTYTALLLAGGIIKAQNTDTHATDWSKVCIIDTERDRSKFYANKNDIGMFKHIRFNAPYSADRCIAALKAAEEVVGRNGVIIIDSLTHFWNGIGGVLDYVATRTESSRTKNQYTEGWGGSNGGTAVQNRLIDRILNVPCHIICTFRQKMDYSMDKDDKGKTAIIKQGVKPIQRDDLEYEFDITLKCMNDHRVEVIKDTTFLGDNGTLLEPLTIGTGELIGSYCAIGINAEEINNKRINQYKENIVKLIETKPILKPVLINMLSNRKLADVNDIAELQSIISNLSN